MSCDLVLGRVTEFWGRETQGDILFRISHFNLKSKNTINNFLMVVTEESRDLKIY